MTSESSSNVEKKTKTGPGRPRKQDIHLQTVRNGIIDAPPESHKNAVFYFDYAAPEDIHKIGKFIKSFKEPIQYMHFIIQPEQFQIVLITNETNKQYSWCHFNVKRCVNYYCKNLRILTFDRHTTSILFKVMTKNHIKLTFSMNSDEDHIFMTKVDTDGHNGVTKINLCKPKDAPQIDLAMLANIVAQNMKYYCADINNVSFKQMLATAGNLKVDSIGLVYKMIDDISILELSHSDRLDGKNSQSTAETLAKGKHLISINPIPTSCDPHSGMMKKIPLSSIKPIISTNINDRIEIMGDDSYITIIARQYEDNKNPDPDMIRYCLVSKINCLSSSSS